MSLTDHLKWRTKKFDRDSMVPDEDIDFLKDVIRLSASSMGLQLYEVA